MPYSARLCRRTSEKVQVTRPQMFEFEDRLELQGTVEAVNVCAGFGAYSRPIDEIFVKGRQGRCQSDETFCY